MQRYKLRYDTRYFLTITTLNLKLNRKTHRCRIFVKTRYSFDFRETATSKPKLLPCLIVKVIQILKGNISYILLRQIRIERCRFTHLVNLVSHDGYQRLTKHVCKPRVSHVTGSRQTCEDLEDQGK